MNKWNKIKEWQPKLGKKPRTFVENLHKLEESSRPNKVGYVKKEDRVKAKQLNLGDYNGIMQSNNKERNKM